MAVDLGVFERQKTVLDQQQLQDAFEAKKQAQALQILQAQKSLQPSFSDAVNASAMRAAMGQSNENDNAILQTYGNLHPRSNVAAITGKISDSIPVSAPPAKPIMQSAKSTAPITQPVKNSTAIGDEYLSSLDPRRATVIKAIGDGDTKISAVLSRMKPDEKISVINDVRRYNPSYSDNDIGGVAEFRKGKLGNQVRAFNTSIEHIGQLEPLIDALNNGDTNLINKIGNSLSKQFGGTAITNFDTAKTIVSDEIAKAIIGSQTAVADRDDLQSKLNTANSPAQLKGVIDTYKGLMAGQLKSLDQQYQVSTGRKDFSDTLLLPNSRKEYLKYKEVPMTDKPTITPSGITYKVLP